LEIEIDAVKSKRRNPSKPKERKRGFPKNGERAI